MTNETVYERSYTNTPIRVAPKTAQTRTQDTDATQQRQCDMLNSEATTQQNQGMLFGK